MSQPKLSAPQLEGFTYVREIEGGGFADVFLYEQHRPRRQVAIKVLRATVTDHASRREFEAEADLMAAVSDHPYIVTVYETDVAPAPDNRPYIVMEFYPLPHFGKRCRDHIMPIAEVLRVGVQLSTAVEFAHQKGIFHRDIKPSNVLTSAHGWPGLTDFGLSTMKTEKIEQARGISIAYAPPEIANEKSPGDERSDVYSLSATVYALLAGRSPFERADRNSYAELLHRIENDAPQPTGRSEAPASLELLLRQGLSKRPGDRPATAAAFARALRDIENRMGFSPTDLRGAIPDPDSDRRRTADDDDPTRDAAQVVHPEGPRQPLARSTSRLIEQGPVEDLTDQQPVRVLPQPPEHSREQREAVAALGAPGAEADEAETVMGLAQTPKPPDEPGPAVVPGEPTQWVRAAVIGAVIVVTAAIVVSLVVLGTHGHHGTSATTTNPGGPSDLDVAPQPPSGAKIVVAGKAATLFWTPAGDADKTTTYLIYAISGSDRGPPIATPPGAISHPIPLAKTSVRFCVQLEARHGDRVSEPTSCAPVS